MSDPVLHVIAGPNGAGKTTFYVRILEPATHLEFVNADLIAAERAQRIGARRSFATETVFSHESKVALLRDAEQAGYRVSLHIVAIPEDLAVARVADRVTHGGHHVPEDKVRARFGRLWGHLRDAIELVDDAQVYDNSTAAEPFRLVASFLNGQAVSTARWQHWAPAELREAGA
jgi:predicted ABC-type ATPase